jgi:hypothetical protein
MDASFNAGFREELEKIGFAIPPSALSVGVPIAVGTALSGLAIYDYLKGKKLDPKITQEFVTGTKGDQVTSSKAIKEILQAKPLLRPVVPVTTPAAVDKMLKDPKFGFVSRMVLEPTAKDIVNDATNAAVIQGEDKDYVIIPRKAHKAVVEHEVGHLQDFARKVQNQPGILARLLSLVWKPEYDKQIMSRERRAWDYVGKPPRREQALKSYERSFHKKRSVLAIPAATAAFFKAIENLPIGGA